jgi:hypothetical protein
VGCHRCGEVLYEGVEMIPFYRLMSEFDGRVTSCKRRLLFPPMMIELNHILE